MVTFELMKSGKQKALPQTQFPSCEMITPGNSGFVNM